MEEAMEEAILGVEILEVETFKCILITYTYTTSTLQSYVTQPHNDISFNNGLGANKCAWETSSSEASSS